MPCISSNITSNYSPYRRRICFLQMKPDSKLIRIFILILTISTIVYIYYAVEESRNQEIERINAEILESKFSKFRDVYDGYHKSKHYQFWNQLTREDILRYRREWQDFVWSIPDRTSNGSKRGIVYTCHDGIAKLNIVSIMMLRRKGCELPVEVWHYGDELGEEAIRHLSAIKGVKVIDLTTNNTLDKPKDDKMFEAKGAALLYSEFDQILFLDSDVLFLIECSSNRSNIFIQP